ncbi:hypothetical protein IKA92_03585, partial [bacterium]|nr:hypothetical protein [bacterium]
MVKDSELEALLYSMGSYYRSFNNPIINQMPSVIVRGLIRSEITPEDFESEEKISNIKDYLADYIKDHADNYGIEDAKDYSVEMGQNQENQRYFIKINVGEDADPVLITRNIIKSNEYDRIKNAYPKIRQFLIEEEKVLIVETPEDSTEVHSFSELQKLIEERGKKGVQLQRFKGLGEMMPQQLWETTMDPTTRTFLKVSIEDAMLCDELFDV